MPRLRVGLLTEQGIDCIVILVAPGFSHRTEQEQMSSVRLLTDAARRAGLEGTVVLVWDGGDGRMAFRAPAPMHGFFSNIQLASMTARLDSVLHWEQVSRTVVAPWDDLAAKLDEATILRSPNRSTGSSAKICRIGRNRASCHRERIDLTAVGDGAAVLKQACSLGLEGVIAKRSVGRRLAQDQVHPVRDVPDHRL